MNKHEWSLMNQDEKDAFFWTVLDITPEQIDSIIRDFAQESGTMPNSIFIDWRTLAKLPEPAKKIIRPGHIKLVIIPFEGEHENHIILSQQDPHTWGNLFYN